MVADLSPTESATVKGKAFCTIRTNGGDVALLKKRRVNRRGTPIDKCVENNSHDTTLGGKQLLRHLEAAAIHIHDFI